MSRKTENRFQYKGVKYKAVEMPFGFICDDCSFLIKDRIKSNCGMPKDISCMPGERKDERNIKWRPMNENSTN